jgi:hypothetical protein
MTSTRSSLLDWRLPVVVVALCATIALAPALAGVAEAQPNTWGPATALPAGSVAGSDQILSSPTGALLRYSLQNGSPSVATFEAGVLGPETALPGADSDGELGQVAFLPDGTAVMSFAPYASDHLDLVVRLPSGQFGPVFEGSFDEPIVGFAGRPGEVLVARLTYGKSPAYRPAIAATSLSIAANGTLTPTGPPTVLYEVPPPPGPEYGVHFGASAVAMDADGQADVVTYSESVEYADEVIDVSRDAAGTWGAPRSLSAALPAASTTHGLQVAVAPGGRALLDFQTAKYPPLNSGGADQLEDTVWESLREPGGTFSTPTQVVSLAGKGGVQSRELVAAGGDGTVALAAGTESCQNFEDASEVPSRAVSVLVAAPGKPLASQAVSILDTAAAATGLTSLGAGDGQALVGLVDETTTSGTETNFCASITINEEPKGVIDDRGVLLGGATSSERTFGSGPFRVGSSNDPNRLGTYSSGIDLAGDVAVTGSLATSEGAEYDFYTGSGGAPGNEEPKIKTTGTGGGAGTTSAGTGTGGASAATSGTPTSTGASAVTASGGAATVSGSSVTLPATASCSSATASPCTVTTIATLPTASASASSVAAAATTATRTKRKHATKPVTAGRGSMTLAAGATGALHLTLTSRGLALLRARHTLSVAVTVTIAGAGRATTTGTLHFVLKLKRAAKTKTKTKPGHHSDPGHHSG